MKRVFTIILLSLSLTARASEYHVSPSGSDACTGNADTPLRTISAAARKAVPGDTVTVHAGIYREWVDPLSGGTDDSCRILYRAAEGEVAEIRGSEPETAILLLEKCTEFILKYVSAMKRTGISGVIMAEPAAGLVSNDDCFQYSTVFVKRIIDAVQDDDFTVILHNCGNTGHCTDAMVRSGARTLHFGNKADMLQALKDCPRELVVMGNIDPVSVMKDGTPELVRKKTSDLLEATSDFGNFVLSTGCDVPPHIPEDNIAAFYKALSDYNNRQ